MKTFKTNNKRLIIFSLSILIFTFCILSNVSQAWVSAEGEKCSSKVGSEYVSKDGDYYYFPDHYKVLLYDGNGKTTIDKYAGGGEKRKKYILIDKNNKQKQVFCLEAGIHFDDSDSKYVSKNGKNSKYFQNLPFTARYGIMLASIYGSGILPSELKETCNKDDFKFAAQCIIWEYQQQLRKSPTKISAKDEIEANTYLQGITGRPAKKAYDWILKQMDKHQTIPSFSAKDKASAKMHTLTYHEDIKKYSLTVTDTNNTLSDLVFDTSNGISISRNGNQYTITSNKIIEDSVTITAKKRMNQNLDDLLIWGRSGYQTMISGAEDPVEFYLKIDTENLGELELSKLNTNGDFINGAIFHITGPNGYEKDVTITDGKVKLEKLKVGTYYVTEKSVPEGYLLDTKTYSIEVKTNEIAKKTITNNEPTGEIKIEKTDVDTGNNNRVDGTSHHGDSSIKGAVYTLYASTDIYNKAGTIKYFSKDEEIATFHFNEYGTATAKIINMTTKAKLTAHEDKVRNLPLGTYYAKETIVPNGYTQDENIYTYHLAYKDSGTKVVNNSGTVRNIVQKAPFTVIKISTNNNTTAAVIEGAEFTAILTRYVNFYGSFDKARKHIDEFAKDEYAVFTTGKDGHGTSGLLAYGEYMVVETYTPSSQINTVEPFYVNIDKNSDTPIKEFIENDLPFEAYIKIKKQDKSTGKTITYSNAKFELYQLNETTNQWEQVKCKVGDNYHNVWNTNGEGIATTETKLQSGTYKLKEIKSPYGFLLSNEEVIVKVDNRNKTLEYDKDWDAWITVIVQNERVEGQLEINKTINLNKNVDTSLIKNIDFTKISFELIAKEDIIDYIDGAVIYIKGTRIGIYNLDKNGRVVIKHLKMGKYYLKEISTIEGVVLDNTKHDIILEQTDMTTKNYHLNLNIENYTTLVKISKISLTGEKELPGAELCIKDEKGNIIDKWISTERPHMIEGLSVGKKYILTEIKAPSGYEIAKDIIFIMSSNKEIQTIIMRDIPIQKAVQIVKKDSNTNEIIKANFVFGIYEDERCTKLIKEVKSDKNIGTVTFGGLVYGTYYIKETKAPKGYQLSNQIVKIEINDKGIFVDNELIQEDNHISTITYKNKPIPKIQTGSDINCLLLMGTMIVSLLGIIIGMIAIKRNRKKIAQKQ